MELGPKTKAQMERFGRLWRQGQHVLETAATGAGKTTLARPIIEQRLIRGGYVVVFVAKLQRDRTLESDYKGFKRWTRWQRPHIRDNRILLWPDISKAKTVPEARKIQRDVFEHALDSLSRQGSWTIVIDEGLYMTDSLFMNLSGHIAMLFQLGRSADLSMVMLSQRPSHLPVVIYSSVAHAFIGRATEDTDIKRLSNLGARESTEKLREMIADQRFFDFVWIPARNDLPAERLRLDR